MGAPTKRETVAGIVRGMIADGTLKPGDPVPPGAELARRTGYSALTCQAASRRLLADGTLTRGVSPTARLRVAQPGAAGASSAETPREALSKALAGRRRAAGMTQLELAGKLGVSLTAVGHAETGRTWQGRDFWRRAGRELGDDGRLLAMYDDRHKGAECGLPEEAVVWPDGTETLAVPPGCRDRRQAGQQSD